MENKIDRAPDLAPENRPGTPMEILPPRALTDRWPEPQKSDVEVFKRKGLEQLTPVFGTMQPPRGLSGFLKRIAYQKAEDEPSHWALLLFSDRVDVIEGRLADAARNPLLIAATAIGIAGGIALLASRKKRGPSKREARKAA